MSLRLTGKGNTTINCTDPMNTVSYPYCKAPYQPLKTKEAVVQWSASARAGLADLTCTMVEFHRATLIFQKIAEWRKITHMLPTSSMNPDINDIVQEEHKAMAQTSHVSRQQL